MNKIDQKDCAHIYGVLTSPLKDRGPVLISQPNTQINGNENVTYFQFCPRCGKQHTYSIFLTEDGFKRMLSMNDRFIESLKNQIISLGSELNKKNRKRK